jgi:ABC-type sugar transport system, periplasmic component
MGVIFINRKYIISSIIVFTMFFSLNAGCAEKTQGVISTATEDTTAETSEETKLEPTLPDADYEGLAINFLTEKNMGYDWYTSKEIDADEQNGELFNDAVYSRNLRVEERFNVKITQLCVENAVSTAKKSLSADDTEFDVTMPYMNSAISLPQQGLFLDLYSIPYLQLDNPWWDQRANENLIMNGKLFFTTGDISILDNECTMVMFFNKELIEDYRLNNPYGLVSNHEWTLDQLFEMSSGITSDINGDGALTKDDMWGLSCASNAPHSFFFASGERIADTGSDGTLELVMNTQRAAEVIDKIMDICFDDTVLSKHTGGSDFDQVSEMFNAGRVLFVTFALVDINSLRDAEFEFGILPYPLYDENQSEYNNLISTGLVPALSVPYNCKNTEAVGVALEAMAYYSVDTLTAAYYDNALKTRYIRDEESGAMLDIIFSTRVYDLGYIYDWGGIGSLIYNMYMDKSSDFASRYAKIEQKVEAEIQKTIDAFSAIN